MPTTAGPIAAPADRGRRCAPGPSFGPLGPLPSVTAKRRCPDLIFVKPRFEVYKAVSQQIRDDFAEYTQLIERLSLDEAYLNVTENVQNIPLEGRCTRDLREDRGGDRVQCLRRHLLQQVSCETRVRPPKPNGQYVITPEMGPAFVEAGRADFGQAESPGNRGQTVTLKVKLRRSTHSPLLMTAAMLRYHVARTTALPDNACE